MSAHRQRFLNVTTTIRADLACAIGIHLDQPYTGSLCLILKHLDKLPPTSITDAFGNVTLGQSFDVQILDRDQSVFVNQSSRQLVMKVMPFASNVSMKGSYLSTQLFVLATAPSASSSSPLQGCHLFFGLSEPSGVVYQLSCRQGRKVFESHINAHCRFVSDSKARVEHFDLENSIPISDLVPFENNHLDFGVVRNRPMLKDAHEAHVLDVEPSVFEPSAVPVDVADGPEPAFAFEARVAGFFLARFDAPKEGLKGLIQTAKGLLKGGIVAPGYICVKGTDRFELVGLVGVTNAHSTSLPGFTSFFQGIVVDLAVNLQDTIQGLMLLAIWIETVLEGQFHLLAFLRFDILLDRFFGDVAYASNIVAATPQAGQTRAQFGVPLPEHVRGKAFELVSQSLRRFGRVSRDKQADMIGRNLQGFDCHLQFSGFSVQ